ncbi:MAG: RNA pyrophosphohydrolase [Pseudomonadota bacterium]
MAKLPYRPCVGIMLLNSNNLVFVGKRKSGPEQQQGKYAWQMPQGGIDEGEEPLACAKRELYEETNIKSIELLAEVPGWLTYDLPPELVGKAWKGKYRGQTQKWFIFRFTGKDKEIDVETPGGGKHKPEFIAWEWVEASILPDVIVPFKRKIYQELVALLNRINNTL